MDNLVERIRIRSIANRKLKGEKRSCIAGVGAASLRREVHALVSSRLGAYFLSAACALAPYALLTVAMSARSSRSSTSPPRLSTVGGCAPLTYAT